MQKFSEFVNDYKKYRESNGMDSNVSPEQVADQENAIMDVMTRLTAVAEAYPDLKANQMFTDTMASIRQYEENFELEYITFDNHVLVWVVG